jgi:hypothetical protein
MIDERASWKTWGRWVATFVGFPLAGVAARTVAGDIDTAGAAAIGGLAAGVVLGTVQAVVGGIDAGGRLRWIGTTAAGLTVGLAVGATAVDYRTDTASLVAMGAVTGAAVGVTQALSIPMGAVDRLLWAAATPVLWAVGWLITSQVIVDTERHHALFGSSGALVVSALAGVLQVLRTRRERPLVTLLGRSGDRAAA